MLIVAIIVFLCVLHFANTTSHNTTPRHDKYEECFKNRMGHSPSDFIKLKLYNGSDPDAVKYAYELTASVIERDFHVVSKPFEHYYRDNSAISKSAPLPISGEMDIENIDSSALAICERELLFGTSFLQQYDTELSALSSDIIFMQEISAIAKYNRDIEFCPNAYSKEFKNFKLTILINEFDSRRLTENTNVKSIISDVTNKGKSKKSAIISIYYSLRRKQLS